MSKTDALRAFLADNGQGVVKETHTLIAFLQDCWTEFAGSSDGGMTVDKLDRLEDPKFERRVGNWRARSRWRVSGRSLSMERWVHNSTMATFPAPASSNGACGFPALRFPACFAPRVMRPIVPEVLSTVSCSDVPGSY